MKKIHRQVFISILTLALVIAFSAFAAAADIQVGGTDQLFNIIVAGRKLQEALGQKPLVGVICGILPGTDGVQRMSKSMGNIVPITSSADDMYGKIDADTVERIEIVRGPHSVLYGSNALGGVINVISRTAPFSVSFPSPCRLHGV